MSIAGPDGFVDVDAASEIVDENETEVIASAEIGEKDIPSDRVLNQSPSAGSITQFLNVPEEYTVIRSDTFSRTEDGNKEIRQIIIPKLVPDTIK